MDRKVGPEHYETIDLWNDVKEEEWNDWRWQLKNRVTSYEALSKIVTLIPEEIEAVKHMRGKFSMAITPYWASMMDPINPFCPIRRQAIPLNAEFEEDEHELVDPCGEDKDATVAGLVHRYPDRVLLLATENCGMYCRHCTRRRLVGDSGSNLSKDRLEKAYEYLRSNKKIRDVLISGGDPFMLEDEKLEDILKNIRAIAHIEFMRIGTRLPVTLPQRITEDFVAMLKKYNPLWISIHCNHPKELTKQARKALDMLADAGFPLGSQTVLLKGINDRVYTMKRLMHELLKTRVRPYYIYQCDLARGTKHFRTSVSTGLAIMEKLRGHTSGYAVPTYVIDAPSGGGKIPVSPNYVVSYEDGVYTLRNYKGKLYQYYESKEALHNHVASLLVKSGIL